MRQYSVVQAAEACRVSHQTLRNAIRQGIITPTVLNPASKRKIYVLTQADVDAYKRYRMQHFNESFPELDDPAAAE